jgi:hypothetical protein
VVVPGLGLAPGPVLELALVPVLELVPGLVLEPGRLVLEPHNY